jgi:hypothetical protein
MRLASWAVVLLIAGQSGSSPPNPDYRCQLVFTRIRYGDSADAVSFYRGRSAWSHDYPRADLHLSRLLSELTKVDANIASTNVFRLDDPELFRHPISYLSEPGFWTMGDEEAERLRSYLLKGGFLIFDDFELEQWDNFEAQMKRVLPEHRLIQIDVDHPVFQSFFEMKTIDFPHPLVPVSPTYYGIFEDDDPSKRLMVIVNYNNDVAEYWEWSDQGWFPIDITNEAYKLGINYMVYALTH